MICPRCQKEEIWVIGIAGVKDHGLCRLCYYRHLVDAGVHTEFWYKCQIGKDKDGQGNPQNKGVEIVQ